MLSLLNKLTLQKELQQNKKQHKNRCRSRELNPGPLAPKADELPRSAPPSKMNVSIVVKLWVETKINKTEYCGPHIFNKLIFSVIFFYMQGYLYLAVYHINGCRFHCLNMVKMLDVNNSDLKDTDIFKSNTTEDIYTICLLVII